MKKLVSAALFATALGAASLAHAVPSLSFVMSGDTYGATFSFKNTSTDGEKLERFVLDLSTITTGGPFCFDTVVDGACNPDPQSPLSFSAANGTGVTTGLYAPLAVPDGATILDLRFNDFNAGETLMWTVDIDSATQTTVLGSDLLGATVTASFSNGMTAVGTLASVPGNSQASALNITGVAPTAEVPEPGSMALFGLAGAALLYRRKKK